VVGGMSSAGGPASQQVGNQTQRQRQVFAGLVKNGVVHLIEGELPDGVMVKVVWE
jgi:hypothetical protein